MADKVENILEQMTEKLQYYIDEEIFSKKEVKKIVKERRNSEYKLQRKDANLLFFLDSIKFEKKLEKLRQKRVRKQDTVSVGKQKHALVDHSINRRVMYLYDRATRKFRQNIALWKEYLQYLVERRANQKLNRVLSKAVQTHPSVLDFWLIGVYTELDVKGNLFSGRKLMLQAIRNNPENSSFYIEYFRFEVRLYEKVRKRIEILNGKGDKKIDFIMDEADGAGAQEKENEGRLSSSQNFVEIVYENIVEKFGKTLELLKESHMIAKQSIYLSDEFKLRVRQHYQSLKHSDQGILQYVQIKLSTITKTDEIKALIGKLDGIELPQTIRKEVLYLLRQQVNKMMKCSPQYTNDLFWLQMKHLELSVDEQIETIFEYKKHINRDSQYAKLVADIASAQNNSLPSLVLQLNLQGDIVTNESLAELEKKGWIKIDTLIQEKAVLLSKKLILKQMIIKGRIGIAEEYLKKCLISYSANFDFLANILTAYSKLIKQSYPSKDILRGIDFAIQTSKKASVIISDVFFQNLCLSAYLHLSIKDQAPILKEINYERLMNGHRKNEGSAWLEYIKVLLSFGEHSDAKKAFERALLSISNAEKDQFVVTYNQLVTKA